MLHQLEHQTLRFLRTHAKSNEICLLACVSGGADSMALLHILNTLRNHSPKRNPLKILLAAIHFNHERRGDESNADEKLVRECAQRWDIPLVVERWSETGGTYLEGNFQEQARMWRYQRATLALKQVHFLNTENSWLLTAHHARDNAESLLLNITRGCGIDGLQGIASCDKSRLLLRPLIEARSADLRNYINFANVPFREDSSNATTDYSRNLLRHKVLPILAELNPNLESAFTRLAESARSVLEEIHVPDNALPLSAGASTTQILRLAKKTNPQLGSLMTHEVLNNILHHLRIASRRKSPIPKFEVALAHGWRAEITDLGLTFVKTNA